VAVALAMALATARAGASTPPTSWDYPLLPHLHALAFWPQPPNDRDPVSVTLSALYHGECWSVLDAHTVDPQHVSVTLAHCDAPTDTSVLGWTHTLELGVVPQGVQPLTVTVTLLGAGGPPTVEERTIGYEVSAYSPPPPPPPSPGDTSTVVLGIWVTPEPATTEYPVNIAVLGRAAFECPQITSPGIDADTLLRFTIEPGGCPDTTRRWRQDFALGLLAEGRHTYRLQITAMQPSGLSTRLDYPIVFDVYGPGGPPPPPPPPPPAPNDSTTSLVTAISVSPERVTVADAVTLSLQGRMPFDCPRLTGSPGVGEPNITLEFAPGGCPDTVRTWRQDLAIGVLSKGEHWFLLDVAARTADSTAHERRWISIRVIDPNDPPPPPEDSLHTVMSASQPNPVRDESRFSVTLGDPQRAEVAVFDLGGRRVATVFRGELPTGTSWLAWNGRRADGSRAPGGIYFYRLSLPNRVVTRRLILLTTP
jgi:hypothetical protein